MCESHHSATPIEELLLPNATPLALLLSSTSKKVGLMWPVL